MNVRENEYENAPDKTKDVTTNFAIPKEFHNLERSCKNLLISRGDTIYANQKHHDIT
jgi:hypothetical protein